MRSEDRETNRSDNLLVSATCCCLLWKSNLSIFLVAILIHPPAECSSLCCVLISISLRLCRKHPNTEAWSESSSGRLTKRPQLGAENDHRRPVWTHQGKTRAFWKWSRSSRSSLRCRSHAGLWLFMRKDTFGSRSSIGCIKFRLVVAEANMTPVSPV